MSIRKNASLLLALCAFVALASAVTADQAAQVKKAIQTALNKGDTAIMKKDIKGALAFMTPDFVSTDQKGKQSSLAEEKQKITQVLSIAKDIKSRSVIQKLTLKGKEAVILDAGHVEMNLSDPRSSKTAHLVIDATAEETWVKTARGWLCKRSKTLAQKMTLNGQPVPDNLGSMDKSL